MAWPWDWINSATDALGALLALPFAMADILMQLFMAAIYPVFVIWAILIGWVNLIMGAFSGLLNGMLMFLNMILLTVSLLLQNVYPIAWVTLITAGIMIRFGERIYSYIKDISILGFKI